MKEKRSSESASFREYHPYGEFIPKKPQAMIIGSFPIGKFTNPARRSEIKSHEHDFFFGGEKNLLWKLLGEVFSMKVDSRDNIINLLSKYHLAIGDVIVSCVRKNQSASDADLTSIVWNENLLSVLHQHHISKVFFTSKRVEEWFGRLFPHTPELEKVTLISPSAQSVRSLDRREDFQKWLRKNPASKRFEFILQDYKRKFETML